MEAASTRWPDPRSPTSEWTPAEVPTAAAKLVEAGFSDRFAALLARRGISDPESARTFFEPDLSQLHDPHLLAGLDDGIRHLLAARDDGRPVALVGDYDVDGISGTALLTAVLRHCGVDVRPMVPHRLHDGYGFRKIHVEKALALGCGMVVTVDCGTTSHEAVAAALDAGLAVVVTDHHLPGESLPDGAIQINPRQAGCDYPFQELCGAGLAFKLASAFAAACERDVDPRALLRIACLGTIADLVPLRGENRVITALGLRALGETRSPGLLALLRTAGVKPPYSTSDVGYRLGPRLNAPGRLESGELALELLLCREPRRAQELAVHLDRLNRQRQDEEERVVREAREVFLGRLADDGAGTARLPPILVAWSEAWHRGVVGIAAGRLARDFHRPTLLLSLDETSATGSGRSIAGLHLHAFLTRWRDDLIRFGGHAQAVGLTAPADRLEELRSTWEQAAEEWADLVAVRRYEYEIELEARGVTAGILANLKRLEPFGQGNSQPLVRIRGPLRLRRSPRLFGRGHLSAEAEGSDGGRIRLLGWGWQERSAVLGGEFEALGYLEHDSYRGGPVVQLVDCRPYEVERGRDPGKPDSGPPTED